MPFDIVAGSTIPQLPVGTWDLDFSKATIQTSGLSAELYGMDDKAVVGSSICKRYYDRIDRSDWPTVERQLLSSISEGTAYDVTYRVADLNGTMRRVFAHGSTILNAVGNVERFIGFITDLSDVPELTICNRDSSTMAVNSLIAAREHSRAADDKLLTYLVDVALLHAQRTGRSR